MTSRPWNKLIMSIIGILIGIVFAVLPPVALYALVSFVLLDWHWILTPNLFGVRLLFGAFSLFCVTGSVLIANGSVK